MLNIAVCERDTEYLNYLCGLTQRYLDRHKGLHARVWPFESARELLAGRIKFDLCILETEQHGVDGFETARRLHRENPDARVIFLSQRGDPACAVKAYQVHAVHYLVKPVEEDSFFEALNRGVRTAVSGPARRIVVNSTLGLVNLRMAEIQYAKSSGHRVSFFLRNGEQVDSKCLRISFGDIIAPLLENGFIRCHDSYTVNLACVEQLTPEGLLLRDGAVVPVSSKKRAWVRSVLKV